MASLLFHSPLLLLLLVACSSSYTQHVTIQVSDTGVDVPNCMNNGETCKTLAYVLTELPYFWKNTNFTDVTVNITCNQTITNDTECNLASKSFMSVRIVGHNKVYITIISDYDIHVVITQYNDTSISWAWIGLNFMIISGSQFSGVEHQSLRSLTILNCSIMSGTWGFFDIQNVVINSSKFGQVMKDCPSLRISTSQQVCVTFFNNTFSDCFTNSFFEPMINCMTS